MRCLDNKVQIGVSCTDRNGFKLASVPELQANANENPAFVGRWQRKHCIRFLDDILPTANVEPYRRHLGMRFLAAY